MPLPLPSKGPWEKWQREGGEKKKEEINERKGRETASFFLEMAGTTPHNELHHELICEGG